jgi:hypothetical protein
VATRYSTSDWWSNAQINYVDWEASMAPVYTPRALESIQAMQNQKPPPPPPAPKPSPPPLSELVGSLQSGDAERIKLFL